MIWLILSIISSTGIFVTFKFIDKTKTPLINAIVINYLIASVFGFFLTGSFPVKQIFDSAWIYESMLIGVLFIIMFFVIGLSSKKAGISITTVAGKMAVVIPMIFAIVAYDESVSFIKIASIVLAVIAVIMSIYKKQNQKSKLAWSAMFLPLILFVGMGIVDSTVIYSKEKYISAELSSVFSASLFSFALISGLIYTLFRPKTIKAYANLNTWILGSILGIVNFGSIYLMLRTLNSGLFSNSIAYGIVNIGIVSLSVLIGTLFFKEKLTKLNYSGIVLSILTIILLTYADL